MNKFSILLLTVVLFSCKSRNDKSCRYTMDNLLEQFDASFLTQNQYKTEHVYEITDVGSNIGVKGIYKFDGNKTLRFYAFLLNDNNDYVFSRSYDTLGNMIGQTGREVIQWYFRKETNDSIKVTFYLFGLNQRFSRINLKVQDINEYRIDLFKSPIFSNILGGSFKFIVDKSSPKRLSIRGFKEDLCLKTTKAFADTAEIPFEVMK